MGADRYEIQVHEYTKQHVSLQTISVIRETTLQIFINDQPLLSLACTGKFPAYLAAGFLFSCGIIESADDIAALDIKEYPETIEARVSLLRPTALPPRTVTSGLGSTFHLPRRSMEVLSPPVKPEWQPENIMRLSGELEKRADLYHLTRGCHNSSLCTHDSMILFREDIGRHNAIDTIIGQCLLEKLDTSNMMILSTGRIASEIVQKVVRARIPMLASTAAATSMAVEAARSFGLGMLGKVSAAGMWIYNDNGRIIFPQTFKAPVDSDNLPCAY